MQITTKFNPQDELWMIRDNKVVMVRIYHMQINCNNDTKNPIIKYTVNNVIPKTEDSAITVNEKDNLLFYTKEELLKSL